MPHVASAAPRPHPARPPHPQPGCRPLGPIGRGLGLGLVSRFHQLEEGKTAQVSGPPPESLAQPACSTPCALQGTPGRTETGQASEAGDQGGGHHGSEPPWPLLQ